ncbi:MAG TPA: type II toxin-antitoxin system VapC family toxin [Acidobacteriaceae bacterium]|nr:type II toxin-antitoxin system VapC family toxin [Acidobacteriaceae bacterium]
MIVVDASLIIEVLLQSKAAPSTEQRIFSPRETLCAPHLLDLEVAQVLRRHVSTGALAPERALQAVRDLADLPLDRYPHYLLLPRIWQLRDNLTSYDAAYQALAEALDAPLVTRDRALGSTNSTAVVEVL